MISKIESRSNAQDLTSLSHKYHVHDWDELLTSLGSQPLDKKLDFQYYIAIRVIYSGSSGLRGSKWLSMGMGKVAQIRDSLEKDLLDNFYARIWPEILVNSKATAQDKTFEGCFIIGIDLENKQTTIPIIDAMIEKVRTEINEDLLTDTAECIMTGEIIEANNLPSYQLVTDERVWKKPELVPEQYVTGIIVKDCSRTPSYSPSRSRNRKSKGKTNSGSDTIPEALSSPKISLRPAKDILNRLKYDKEKYDIDEWVIGYWDRPTEMVVEKPASEWVGETTHEEFIPEHRIEYFAGPNHKHKFLWHRQKRIDNCFGSGSNASQGTEEEAESS